MVNLEAMASATLLASLEPERLSDRDYDRFSSAMDQLSDTAFRAYRDLVYGTDGFTTFFRQMTPTAAIAGLKLGSRDTTSAVWRQSVSVRGDLGGSRGIE